jgi:hypothetical protein
VPDPSAAEPAPSEDSGDFGVLKALVETALARLEVLEAAGYCLCVPCVLCIPKYDSHFCFLFLHSALL